MTTTLAGFAFSFLAAIITAWLKSAKTNDALEQEGADKANAAANKESNDALSRMAAANAQPRDRASVSDRLRQGSA